jgi:hypothetical protein
MLHTCGGTVAPPSDANPRRIIGTQHKKSDITISVILLAIDLSDFAFDFLTAVVVFLATKNIHKYEIKITKNDTKFRTKNTNTEYSHPFGLSGVM